MELTNIINEETKKENEKQKRELAGVLEFKTYDIIIETNKMILIKINYNTSIWLPISNLWLNKVKVHTFRMPVYVDDERLIRFVTSGAIVQRDIKLSELLKIIALSADDFNCKIIHKKEISYK